VINDTSRVIRVLDLCLLVNGCILMLIEDLKELLLVISIIDTAAPTSLRVSCLLYQHVSR